MQAEKLTWSAVQNDDRIALHFAGELIRDRLLPLWNVFQKGEQHFAFLSEKKLANQNLIFDLSKVTRIDSAGFALLCQMIYYCHQTQPQLKLVLEYPPAQLLTLADLFGLEQWIKSFL